MGGWVLFSVLHMGGSSTACEGRRGEQIHPYSLYLLFCHCFLTSLPLYLPSCFLFFAYHHLSCARCLLSVFSLSLSLSLSLVSVPVLVVIKSELKSQLL